MATIKDTNSLKYLMNEVISEKRMTQKINSNTIKFTSLDETAINSLLNSDVFSINESNAVRILFSKTNTKTLTESTIKKLDKSVNTIVESFEGDAILSEGFFGDIWDGLKGLGDKAKEALSGGWSKVKAIWGEFTELVKEVASACKVGFVKAFDSFADKAKGASAKVADGAKEGLAKITDKNAFLKEVKEMTDTNTYITKTFYTKWFAAPEWEKDMIAGNATPSEEVKVEPAKAEDGLEDLKTMESVRKMNAKIIKERNNLLSNSDVVNELFNSSEKRLFIMEGGGFAHIEGAIKNPFLKGVVEWSVKILQALFIPIAKIAQTVAAAVGKEVLPKYSESVKLLGGPGAFKFVIIGGILSELIELAVKAITPSGPAIAAMFIPGLGPIILGAETLIKTVKSCLMVWTIATIAINMVPVLQKAGGTAAKAESYTPKGEFKMQNGNLLFIK
jgi:hypothetical protein